jgi:hypothetical protein
MGEALIVRRGGAVGEISIFIEPGLIVEWFGLSSGIPDGWALCDGTNDTPNLVDKFIVGAGDTYAVGATGGFADAIIPSHTHTGSTDTAGSHGHTYSGSTDTGTAATTRRGTGGGNVSTAAGGSHTHTSTINSTGVSATNLNLPPYFGLFHIIKVEE